MSDWSEAQRATEQARLDAHIAHQETRDEEWVEDRAYRADRRWWNYPDGGEPE